MAFKSAYLQGVYDKVAQRNKGEEEFLQAVREVLETLEPVIEKRQDIVDAGILERIVEPERMIQFRVAWVDDNGKVQVNRGYRVQLCYRTLQGRSQTSPICNSFCYQVPRI